ncbi:MAG: NADH-quinone oxidoreductase subunit I [Candidatus Methylomirabilales bacterium]
MENIDKPKLRTDYVTEEVTGEWLKSVRKPPRYIDFIPELCILCEGCVDICPWYCIFMLTPEIVSESGPDEIARDMRDNDILFVIDDDACTRCNLCVERCPTGALVMARLEGGKGRGARHLGTVGAEQRDEH